MVIKMIKEFRRRMDVQSKKSEVCNKELQNIKNHTEMKNTIMETKHALEGINSRLNDTKKWIRELEITAAEQKNDEKK